MILSGLVMLPMQLVMDAMLGEITKGRQASIAEGRIIWSQSLHFGNGRGGRLTPAPARAEDHHPGLTGSYLEAGPGASTRAPGQVPVPGLRARCPYQSSGLAGADAKTPRPGAVVRLGRHGQTFKNPA